MDENPERRQHYVARENVPLSESIREAVRKHEATEPFADEAVLVDHVDVESLDQLFTGSDGVTLSLKFALPNVAVSVWGDDEVPIRVTADDR